MGVREGFMKEGTFEPGLGSPEGAIEAEREGPGMDEAKAQHEGKEWR